MLSPQVFVIASFDPEGQAVQVTVRRAIEEAGFRVVRYSGSIRPGAVLTSNILDRIREADLIIADVSRQNPNVLYEVGFAHTPSENRFSCITSNPAPVFPATLTGFSSLPMTPEFSESCLIA